MAEVLIVLVLTLVFLIVLIEEQKNRMHNNLKIHFLDTGNSDCIFITSEYNFLIDCASREKANYMIGYLKGLGVKKIDYLLLTYPHDNHVGGLITLLKTFEIGEILMCHGLNTIDEYKSFVRICREKTITSYIPKEGTELSLGKNCNIKLYNCELSEEQVKNNWSIIAKLTCGERNALFMADAQIFVEEKYFDIWEEVAILKVGRHGHISSSSERFVKKVNPCYAVVTTGDNLYGYPSEKVLKRYRRQEATVLRTDKVGNIVFTIEENKIKYETY